MKNKQPAPITTESTKALSDKYDESKDNGVVLDKFLVILNKLDISDNEKKDLQVKILSEDNLLKDKSDQMQQVIINKVVLGIILLMAKDKVKDVGNIVPLCNCLMESELWLYLMEENILPYIFKIKGNQNAVHS